MSGGTAPGIMLGLAYHPSPHGISFHIPYGGPKMFIVERTGKRPSLPQSPADLLGPVEVLGVAQVQRPEHRCEPIGSFRYANEVDVLCHEAISQGLQPVLGGILQQELKISLPIAIFEKDIFSSIAPLSDVMRNSRNNHPRNSRHGANLITALSNFNRK